MLLILRCLVCEWLFRLVVDLTPKMPYYQHAKESNNFTGEPMAGKRAPVLLAVALLLGSAGCKKSKWIEGKWLLVTPEGKPGVCHEFKGGKKKEMLIYTGTACSGPTDPLLSGKWQLKSDSKLAILQGTEEQANLVLITERDDKHFVASSGISGKLYRVTKEKSAADLVRELTEQGEIALRPMPAELGCKQLGMPLSEIKALPTEAKPRMIRQKDQGLEYHANRSTGDPKVEKVVYALNQEVIEWVAFHLTPAAFQPPGPEERIQVVLGQPSGTAGTGTGDKRQHIAMWRTYCAKLRGANNKDVDVTLFATTGQQRGTIYVSENIVSGIWEELKKAIDESPPEEEAEGEGEAPAKTAPAPAAQPTPAPAAPKAAPAPTPKPTPPPPAPKVQKRPPPAAPKPAGSSSEDDPI